MNNNFIFVRKKYKNIMKKIFLFGSLMVLSALSVFSQNKSGNSKATPKTNNEASYSNYVLADFREIKWGTHIDSVYREGQKINFTKSNSLNFQDAYVIANDNMVVGTVTLSNIYYSFGSNQRFNRAILIGEKEKQFFEMKYIVTYKFGEPQIKEIPNGMLYSWSVDDVRITLMNNKDTGHFTLEFYSDFEISESKKINRSVSDF